jgi:hypothetical protein
MHHMTARIMKLDWSNMHHMITRIMKFDWSNMHHVPTLTFRNLQTCLLHLIDSQWFLAKRRPVPSLEELKSYEWKLTVSIQ